MRSNGGFARPEPTSPRSRGAGRVDVHPSHGQPADVPDACGVGTRAAVLLQREDRSKRVVPPTRNQLQAWSLWRLRWHALRTAGSLMYLNGEKIVDNDGCHGELEGSATTSLFRLVRTMWWWTCARCAAAKTSSFIPKGRTPALPRSKLPPRPREMCTCPHEQGSKLCYLRFCLGRTC